MTKKILSDLTGVASGDILGYTHPVYHDSGKSFYVDFKAFDPATGTLRRKKYHLDNIKSKRQRKQHADVLINTLLTKLRAGWNPWANVSDFRGYTKLEDVFERYIDHINSKGRLKTVQSYSSRVNILRKYISTLPSPPVYAYQYDRALIIGFIDWLALDREAGGRTINNYLGWCGAFGEYMSERKYIESNPATGIRKYDEKEKKRQPLTEEMLRRLYSYLGKNDRHFLLAVMMEYYTFIRPSELTNLRIRDFSLKDQRVFVSGEFSKNKKDGYVGVNETIIRLMLDLNVFDYPGDCYLFSRGFKPGITKRRGDVFNKRWAHLRKALGWGDEYQFYSLKDSGIRDLANSEGIVIARDQARHSDITTTNKYLGHEKGVREETKSFSGFLSQDDRTPLK